MYIYTFPAQLLAVPPGQRVTTSGRHTQRNAVVPVVAAAVAILPDSSKANDQREKRGSFVSHMHLHPKSRPNTHETIPEEAKSKESETRKERPTDCE